MSTTTILDHMSLLLSSPTMNVDTVVETPAAVAATNTNAGTITTTACNTAIKISRPFDIRRVQNSETEVRLSMDVPLGNGDLRVQMEQDKEQEDVYLLRIVHFGDSDSDGDNQGQVSKCKCFPLTAESIDVNSMKAILKPDAVLEIIAYKTTTTSVNPFQMVADAFQTFTLNTWSNNPNKILRRIPVEEEKVKQEATTTDTTEADTSTSENSVHLAQD